MSLPTAAEMRAFIDAKRSAEYEARIAKQAEHAKALAAFAETRLTSMLEEMVAGLSMISIARCDTNDEAEALSTLARGLGYTVDTRYDSDRDRDGCGAPRPQYVVSVSTL